MSRLLKPLAGLPLKLLAFDTIDHRAVSLQLLASILPGTAAGLRGGWRDCCIVNAPERSGLGALVVLLAFEGVCRLWLFFFPLLQRRRG